MKTRTILLLTVMLAAGCREKPDESALSQDEPTEFTFTDTNETVMAEDIPRGERVKSVEADFNLDGLPDLAILESPGEDEGDAEQIAIYIRKPQALVPAQPQPGAIPSRTTETATSPPPNKVTADAPANARAPALTGIAYYRAGIIDPPAKGSVIGIMVRGGTGKYTDIVLLLGHADRQNLLVHYRNDGRKFTKVLSL